MRAQWIVIAALLTGSPAHAAWFFQVGGDTVCRRIASTEIQLGVELDPNGTRAQAPLVNDDATPEHYTINKDGTVTYLPSGNVIANYDFDGFRKRIFADIKSNTLSPSCVAYTETLIQAFIASIDKAKDYWLNFVQQQILPVNQMTAIQNDAIASRMGAIETTMPDPKPVPTVSQNQVSQFLADCATDSAIPGDSGITSVLVMLALITDDDARKAQWKKTADGYSQIAQNAIIQHATANGIRLQ